MKSSTKPKKSNPRFRKKPAVSAKAIKSPALKSKQKLLGTTRSWYDFSINFKKNILPILVGLVVAAVVFGIFNSQLLSAKFEYYLYERHRYAAAGDSQTISRPIDKNAPAKIIINGIGVNAPVVYSVNQIDESIFLQALHDGVVHYPGTAIPGQAGNVVVFGHSSGLWWAPGDYKFVFTLLDKVKAKDLVFLEYQGVRYIYRVSASQVVAPTDLSVLEQRANSHELTLITCTPVGTSTNRLIVHATQIVPKVESSAPSVKPTVPLIEGKQQLPSNSSSFWQNLREIL